MGGEIDLKTLLTSMKPELSSESYVFTVFPRMEPELFRMRPWAVITEKEGCTVILEAGSASSFMIPGQPVFKRITLNIHSSLEAVGLTAAVSSVLAAAGISANMVAGYYHDHIFVPQNDSPEAMRLLRKFCEK